MIDRRLLRRFRRNPDRALKRFDLSREEVDAVKDGRIQRLVPLGLRTDLVWPHAGNSLFVPNWALRNAKRLAPAALIAAAAFAWPAAGHAATPRSRAKWVRTARRQIRANPQLRARYRSFGGSRSLRATLRRAGVSRQVARQLTRSVDRAFRPPRETPTQ
jgi:hypothetical protein